MFAGGESAEASGASDATATRAGNGCASAVHATTSPPHGGRTPRPPRSARALQSRLRNRSRRLLRRSRRPAAGERLVQRDRRRRAAYPPVGRRILRLQQRPLRIEHFVVVDRTGRETCLRKLRRACAVVRGARQMCGLVAGPCDAQQRVLGFLERAEHRLPVLRELAGRFRVARGDPRAYAADVEKRPVDAERDQIRVAPARKKP